MFEMRRSISEGHPHSHGAADIAKWLLELPLVFKIFSFTLSPLQRPCLDHDGVIVVHVTYLGRLESPSVREATTSGREKERKAVVRTC